MTQAIEHISSDTLSAFIDGELTRRRARGDSSNILPAATRAHFASSPPRELKAATARAGRRFAPPPEMLTRLTAQLHREPRGSTRVYSIRRVAWASLAAAMLLAVSLIGWRQLQRNQCPRRRISRPASRHPFQRSDPAGHFHRSPYGQTLVSGPASLQLQSSRCSGSPSRTRPSKGRILPISRDSPLRCSSSLSTNTRSRFSLRNDSAVPVSRHSPEHPLGIYHPLRHDAGPPHRRRQRRQPRRSRCVDSCFSAGACALLAGESLLRDLRYFLELSRFVGSDRTRR